MSLFNEAELRDLIRGEIRTAIRDELGKAPLATGEFVSVAEAGRIAAVSPQAIRGWIRAGRLPGYNAGRVLRVRRAELEAFLVGAAPTAEQPEASPEELADRHFRRRQAGQRGTASARTR
jgi:excisionase family DNA binding protein